MLALFSFSITFGGVHPSESNEQFLRNPMRCIVWGLTAAADVHSLPCLTKLLVLTSPSSESATGVHILLVAFFSNSFCSKIFEGWQLPGNFILEKIQEQHLGFAFSERFCFTQ